MDTVRLDADLHLLDMRFAGARLVEAQAVERLARSIARDGQIVPCIVVGASAGNAGGGERVVLIDGYRRVAALRRLGRDRAAVERWSCDLVDGVLGVLARAQSRSFAAIEEALLLRELTQGFGLSQLEVARRCGRDDSWVNRRLQLLSSLPDTVLVAVRAGRLSTWAAIRVIAPLARASGAHAERFAGRDGASAFIDALTQAVVRSLPEGQPRRARAHGRAPAAVRAGSERERGAGAGRAVAHGP
jgi:ParB/RepB/Spo0J family partition protein